MEIEINPITLDARIDYLQQISEIQQINKKPLPWMVAIAALLIGVIIGYYIKEEKTRAINKRNGG